MKEFDPPKWALRFFQWFCRPDYYEFIHGDLEELFLATLREKGPEAARRQYARQVIKLCRPSVFRKLPAGRFLPVLNLARHYTVVANRNIWKNKALSAMNVAGLSLGMTVGLLVITAVSDQYSFDNFHKEKERIYRVITGSDGSFDFASSPLAFGEAIKGEVADVEAVTSFTSLYRSLKTGNQKGMISGYAADESFLDVFTFPLIQGNPQSLNDPSVIFLTESLASRFFGTGNAMGESMFMADSVELIVGGLLADPPKNSHLRFDFLVSRQNTDLVSVTPGLWSSLFSSYNYIRLKEDADLNAAQSFANRMSEMHYDEDRRNTFTFQRLDAIYPGPSLVNAPGIGSPEHRLFKIMGGVALVILIFSAFNYASLTTARSFARANEVGVRKAFGAQKRQIILQVLIESVVISLIAGLLAVLLLKLIIPGVYGLHPEIVKTFNLEPGFVTYQWFFVFALFTGLMGGLIPAFYFSRFQPVQALRDFQNVRGFSKTRLRKVLISFQLILGLICVSTALLTQRQFNYEKSFDRGYSSDNLINIELTGTDYEAFRNELERNALIESVTVSSNVPSSQTSSSTGLKWPGAARRSSARFLKADEHFISTFKIDMLASQQVASSGLKAGEVIINQAAMKLMEIESPEAALGIHVTAADGTYKVTGVIEDFKLRGINIPVKPLLILPISDPKEGLIMTVKVVEGMKKEAIAFMQKTWHEVGEVGVFTYADFEDRFVHEGPNSLLTKLLGFFALQLLVVALLGLSGIVKWLTEVRAREMGIRKILGAAKSQLILSLSRSFFALTLLALLIALPVSYIGNTELWLNELTHRVSFDWKILVSSILLLMVPATFLMLMPTLSVLKKNPVEYLRSE